MGLTNFIMGLTNFIMGLEDKLSGNSEKTNESEDKNTDIAIENSEEVENMNNTSQQIEEWVWVTGYKGMDKDMQGYGDFQYELGGHYDMPEGSTIETCHGGFHFCLNLQHVFKYLNIGYGNRYFRVRALVRKRDLHEYGTDKIVYDMAGYLSHRTTIDKLAAKSIEILSELTIDEILKCTKAKDWPASYKQLAIAYTLDVAEETIRSDELVEYGYSLPFATWLIGHKKYDIAKAVGSQPDLSMDMKCLMIMKG